MITATLPERTTYPTGSDAYRQMSQIRANLIARYRLHVVPGRREELEANRPILNGQPVMGKPIVVGDPGKVVSLGYGCRTIRIRKHDGRRWIDTLDVQIDGTWPDKVHGFLDEYFGYQA